MEAAPAIDAEKWSRLCRLVEAALPVGSLDELLSQVTAAWEQLEGTPARRSGECGFDRRLQAAKLEALAEFAAGAGHEINNPLAAISGRVQLLLRDETDPQRRQELATIGGQAYRIRDMIGDLMLFARPPQPQPERLDLVVVLHEVAAGFLDEAQALGCVITVEAAGPLPIWADPTQLRVVLSSLLQNSLEASSQGGPITLAARELDEESRPIALISITDCGCGLSETDRAHLFDPFYSGRQAGRGLGFGLSKCWRIVSNHHGRIEVDSAPAGPDGRGRTTFHVYWPAACTDEQVG